MDVRTFESVEELSNWAMRDGVERELSSLADVDGVDSASFRPSKRANASWLRRLCFMDNDFQGAVCRLRPAESPPRRCNRRMEVVEKHMLDVHVRRAVVDDCPACQG